MSADPPGQPPHDNGNNESPCQVYHQHLSVRFEYPVYFTRGLLAPGNGLLAAAMDRLGEQRRHRAAAYVDGGAAAADPQLIGRIKEYFHARGATLELAAPPVVLGRGESLKTGWQGVRDILWTLGNLHLDRQSFVLAVGGGSLLDMVGFACSIVHRGLRLVRVPTTTLAQCDAGVGVKNGMDEHGVKNFVGTFSPPFAVLNDFDFLRTLPFDDWIGGAAEAFKVAVLRDGQFLDFLCDRAEELRRRNADDMERLVRRCALLHLEHIRTGGDPFEFGSARPLDFGHWSAHKLETMSGYELGHGQAVAVGVALDCFCAARMGLLDPDDCQRVIDALARCGLPIFCEPLERRTKEGRLVVLEGLAEFREHLGGELTLTMPQGLGSRTEVHHLNESDVEAGVAELRRLAVTAGKR